MPNIGDIVSGTKLGYVTAGGYIWAACIDCGDTRWVKMIRGKPQSPRCQSCAGKKTLNGLAFMGLKGKEHVNWKGGRANDGTGYIKIYYDPRGPFAPMRNMQYILEHRLVMAQHLGRCLESYEIVHHKNGVRNDNRIDNLELVTKGQHTLDHSKGYKDGYAKGLADGQNKQIESLSNRIIFLEWQLSEYEKVKALERMV